MNRIVLHAGFCAHNKILILNQSPDSCTFGMLEENEGLKRKIEKAWPEKKLEFNIIDTDTFNVLLARLFSQNAAHDSTVLPYSGKQEDKTQPAETDSRIDKIEDEAPIINLLNSIFLEAISKNASDIHIEIGKEQTAVRFRLDGLLVLMQTLSEPVGRALSARLKVLADLNVLETRRPQDGRIELRSSTLILDVRISIVPAVSGESIVLRILPDTSLPLSLEELGFTAVQIQTIETFLTAPAGLILVTGPTGSGKTTTLASFLHILNKPEVKIISIEDPVEYRIDGITQIQTHDELGLSFDALLKRIFRQDPDIIMIGEIRDSKTAELAVRAALTGHLVFSTLHTNSTAEAVVRLEDLGIPRYLTASVLRAVIAQRLLRRLCVHCRGCRCESCSHTGYRGRIAAAEILPIDEDFSGLISRYTTVNELYGLQKERCIQSIREDAVLKAVQGLTDTREILRELGAENGDG